MALTPRSHSVDQATPILPAPTDAGSPPRAWRNMAPHSPRGSECNRATLVQCSLNSRTSTARNLASFDEGDDNITGDHNLDATMIRIMTKRNPFSGRFFLAVV